MNIGVISNIIRSGLMIVGSVIVAKYGASQEEVTAAVDSVVAIAGVVMASGGAIWSLIRSLKRAKAGVQ